MRQQSIEFRYWSPIGDQLLIAKIIADRDTDWTVGEIIFGEEPVEEPSSLFDAMHEHLMHQHAGEIARAWDRRQEVGTS